MVFVGAGPLKAAQLFEAPIGHPRVPRREAAHFIPDFFGPGMSPVATEAPREIGDDLDVVARLSRRIERFADALDAPFAARHRAFGFAPRRGRRKHDVGESEGTV